MKIRILEGQLESAKEEQSLALQKNLEVSEVGVVEECSEPRDGNASCSIQ